MDKRADTSEPLHELLATRWSPRAFDPQPVSDADVRALLEAARWAPSSYNEQPWRFVWARAGDAGHAAIADLLVPANRVWAAAAPLLLVSCAHRTFSRNDRPNAHAWHDVGLASAQLALEAGARGLSVHFMSGFDRERARDVLGIPDGWDAVAAIAAGRRAEPDVLPPDLAQAERAPRTRLPLDEIAFEGRWR